MDTFINEDICGVLVALTFAGCSATTPEAPQALAARSLDAMGVARVSSSNEGFLFEATGTLDQGTENQGRIPGRSEPTPFSETVAVDVSTEQLAYEYRHDRIDGSEEWVRDLYDGEERTIAVRSEGFAVRLHSKEHPAERTRLWRRFPHLLLREAVDRAVSWSSEENGGEDDTIALELDSGEILVLGLDSETSLLSSVNYVTDVQSVGDAEISWHFEDYRRVDGFGLFPFAYRVTVAGRPFLDMDVVRATSNRDGWSSFFTLPDEMAVPEVQRLPESDAAARAQVETVAPGVHIVKNLRVGFHPMFVELEDGIVALDAPAGYRLLTQLPAGDVATGASSAWLSERFIELIEEAVPDKPIRYVVLTHFHNDHAGGLRAFVARGITVVGPAAIRESVEELVRAPHTFAPDVLSSNPQSLVFEGVTGSRAIGTIEILDVGRNPHSESMLAIHVPDADIVFTSDLVELDPFFRSFLEKHDLSAKRIYAMHAGEPVTIDGLPE